MSRDNELLITKSHSLINYTIPADYSMSVASAKVLNTLIYLFQQEAMKTTASVEEYNLMLGDGPVTLAIPYSEILPLSGKSKNYDHIRSTMKFLRDLKIVWQEGQAFHNLFSTGYIDDESTEVILKIPAETRKLFLDENHAAVVDLLKVNHTMKNVYGVFFHDVIESKASEADAAVGESLVLEIENEELRNSLRVPKVTCEKTKQVKYKFPAVSQFKQKVLDKAVQDYNNADMRFEVLKYDHRNKGQYWNFHLIKKSEAKVRKVAAEHPELILKISDELGSMKYKREMKNELLNSLDTYKKVQYVLYCIEKTKQARGIKSTNQAGYLKAILENNKDAFEEEWKSIQVLEIAQRKKEKAEKQKRIEEQKENARSDFIKKRTDFLLKRLLEDEEKLKADLFYYLEEENDPRRRSIKSKIEEVGFDEQTLRYARQFIVAKLISEIEIQNYINNLDIKINL